MYWTFNAQSKSTLGEKNGMIWDPTFCNKKDYCIIVVKKHRTIWGPYILTERLIGIAVTEA